MYTIYSFLDRNISINFKMNFLFKILYYTFLPIFFLLELSIYWLIWKKLIIPELLTNDEIVDFFEKNDFAYLGNKIKKIDLITANEFYDRMNLEESRQIIKKEFVDVLSELLNKNCSFDIEEYVTLIVSTDIKVIKNNGEIHKARIYSVTIQFCRLLYLQEITIKLIYWILSISTLFGIGYIFQRFFYQLISNSF